MLRFLHRLARAAYHIHRAQLWRVLFAAHEIRLTDDEIYIKPFAPAEIERAMHR